MTYEMNKRESQKRKRERKEKESRREENTIVLGPRKLDNILHHRRDFFDRKVFKIEIGPFLFRAVEKRHEVRKLQRDIGRTRHNLVGTLRESGGEESFKKRFDVTLKRRRMWSNGKMGKEKRRRNRIED